MATALLAGCGGGGPKIVKVSGTATRGGQPVKDFVINFIPEKGRPAWGFTDPDGRYTVHYSRDQDGVAVGKYKVYLRYGPHDPQTQFAIYEKRFQYPPEIKAIEDKYGSPEKSPLEFDIQSSQTIDLKLD
jgi:hypothetical protein